MQEALKQLSLLSTYYVPDTASFYLRCNPILHNIILKGNSPEIYITMT